MNTPEVPTHDLTVPIEFHYVSGDEADFLVAMLPTKTGAVELGRINQRCVDLDDETLPAFQKLLVDHVARMFTKGGGEVTSVDRIEIPSDNKKDS